MSSENNMSGGAAANGEGKEKEENSCSICMSEFEEKDELLTLTCFHAFHEDCIKQWFKEQNWCPVCKNVVKID